MAGILYRTFLPGLTKLSDDGDSQPSIRSLQDKIEVKEERKTLCNSFSLLSLKKMIFFSYCKRCIYLQKHLLLSQRVGQGKFLGPPVPCSQLAENVYIGCGADTDCFCFYGRSFLGPLNMYCMKYQE